MSVSNNHYEYHLGAVYSWMAGGMDARLESNRQFFEERHISGLSPGLAVDLGCGSGFQAIPLAEMGFKVLAMDQCDTLLEELRARTGTLPIQAVHDDLLLFDQHLTAPPCVVVCMGDTLPHLDTYVLVEELFRRVGKCLKPGGLFILTFRDYASDTLTGTQRFIPVRSDESRISTVFLEYEPYHVKVTDLVHERKDGKWEMRVSSYPKLRLSLDWVVNRLEQSGMELAQNFITLDRMICLVARK